jgi:hypothetical protein
VEWNLIFDLMKLKHDNFDCGVQLFSSDAIDELTPINSGAQNSFAIRKGLVAGF